MANNSAAAYPAPRAPLYDSFVDKQRSGRGRYVTVVAAAANTVYSLAHDLGRVPTMLVLLDSGDAPTPRFTWPIAQRGTLFVGVSFDTAGTFKMWIS